MTGAICEDGESNSGVRTGFNRFFEGASAPGRWTIGFGYKWQDSFRHFVGDVEQPQRVLQNTQQENKLHLWDVSLSYRASRRWTFEISGPFMYADRINHRTGGVTHAAGLSDMSVGAKFWIFRPPTETRQNIEIGFSLKMPTGAPDATSLIRGGTSPSTTPTTVDQSIQPGDSGVGLAISYLAYKALPKRFTLFSSGVYLLNPKNTYAASTPGARVLSVADQYVWRGGIGYAVPKLRGLAFSIGGRDEGIPARDLIGREDGFRRPGYSVGVEPGFEFARGRSLWSLSYVIAVHRDRTRSVQDVASGGHGDAAFADGALSIGYARSF